VVQSPIRHYTPDDIPYKLTYGEWTTRWWKWVMSIDTEHNPLLDGSGALAGSKQDSPVWFLAGTLGENKCPERWCTIPREKAILFPVINYEANSGEGQEFSREQYLVQHVSEDQDDIVVKEATVDGQKVYAFRIKSEPAVFDCELVPQNILGLPPQKVRISADGYWVFLRPLKPGNHEIYFHGTCSSGKKNSSARYHLSIR